MGGFEGGEISAWLVVLFYMDGSVVLFARCVYLVSGLGNTGREVGGILLLLDEGG